MMSYMLCYGGTEKQKVNFIGAKVHIVQDVSKSKCTILYLFRYCCLNNFY